MKDFISKDMRTNEIKNEINDIKKCEIKIKGKDLKYETKNYIYDFQQYDTIRTFGDNIYTAKINIDGSEMDQTNLSKNWEEFSVKSRLRTIKDRNKKRNAFESANALDEVEELVLNAFRRWLFPMK